MHGVGRKKKEMRDCEVVMLTHYPTSWNVNRVGGTKNISVDFRLISQQALLGYDIAGFMAGITV